MTLGIGLNVQPFMTACADLRACMYPRHTVMPSAPFLAAAESLYRALSPNHLVGFPVSLRQDVRNLIDHLPKDNISRVMAGVALQELRNKGLFPEKNVAESASAVHALLQNLIESNAGELPAAAMVEGGIKVDKAVYRATLRGLFEDDEDENDTTVFGMVAADGHFHIARPSRFVGKLARPTMESLPQPPASDPSEKIPGVVIPASLVITPEPPQPTTPSITEAHASGVNWGTFLSSLKSGRLESTQAVHLFPDEELYLQVCLEKFEEARRTSQSAVADFQTNFLYSCRDRPDLMGVLLRAAQLGMITFNMVVQAWFDGLQKDDIPLADPSTGRLLKYDSVPLNHDGLHVQMTPPTDYVLGREIGRGGTSTVYLAHEVGPNRDVAIKIVTIPDPQQRDRIFQGFQEERENQGRFSSEHFVHVYNTGWTSQGNPYIAMERCDGALSDWLNEVRTGKRAFKLDHALDMAKQMVMALVEMHKQDYVHRDIKPDNFFMKNGRVKLGDTGISKPLSEIPPTPPQSLWGTPGYIPPEVAEGRAPDSKSNDVFAMGVVLYELLTGRFCFDAPTAQMWLVNSCTQNPPKPSLVVPGRHIPSSIDDLVMTCLEKDPAKRYPDALSLLHALVTVRAKDLIEQANEHRRRSHHTGAEIRINQRDWHDRIKDALRELRRVYDEFPLPSILRQRIDLNKELFDWALSTGDWEELTATRDSILAMDRELQGKSSHDLTIDPITEAAKAVSQRIGYQFEHDDHVDRRFQPRYDTITFVEKEGYVVFSGVGRPRDRLSEGVTRAPLGSLYSLKFSSPYHMPVNIPLPPRHSANGKPYPVRIPTYLKDDFHPDLRERLVIVPAGAAAAMRHPKGALGEKMDDLRPTHHDIGVLPLPSNAEVYQFLREIEQEDPSNVQRFLPQGWIYDPAKGAFSRIHGEPLDWSLPALMNREQSDAYLEYLSRLYERPFRYMSLFEYKLLMRGPDNRVWVSGSAAPEKGDAVFRFPGANNKLEPIDMPHLRDISPFSIPTFEDGKIHDIHYGRAIRHVTGNTFKRLHLTQDEQRRIFDGKVFYDEMMQQYGIYDLQHFARFLRENDILAGVAYDHEPTQTPDGLKSRPRNFRGPVSFFPVTELRPVDTDDWVEALTGKRPSNHPPK